MSPSRACASSTAGAPAGCTPQEIGQIAGRAGRFRSDGTFGVTGERRGHGRRTWSRRSRSHRFEPVAGGRVAQRRLDFASLPGLMRSLAAPPTASGLKLVGGGPGRDDAAPAGRPTPTSAERARDRGNLMRLWDVCQTPDFRKTTLDEHVRLVEGPLFEHLTTGRPARAGGLDRAASSRASTAPTARSTRWPPRLASVRTLAYVANRPDWLADPRAWQGADARARGPALRHPAREADGRASSTGGPAR